MCHEQWISSYMLWCYGAHILTTLLLHIILPTDTNTILHKSYSAWFIVAYCLRLPASVQYSTVVSTCNNAELNGTEFCKVLYIVYYIRWMPYVCCYRLLQGILCYKQLYCYLTVLVVSTISVYDTDLVRHITLDGVGIHNVLSLCEWLSTNILYPLLCVCDRVRCVGN